MPKLASSHQIPFIQALQEAEISPLKGIYFCIEKDDAVDKLEKAYYDFIQQKIAFLLSQKEDLRWKKTQEQQQLSGFQAQNYEGSEKIIISRAIGQIQGHLEDVTAIITDKSKSKILNPGEKINLDLVQIDENLKVKFVRSKAPLIDDRYTIFVQNIQKKENRFIIVQSSVDYENIENVHIKNAVESKIDQIWILEQVEMNAVSVEFLTMINPGGNIPNYIRKKVGSKFSFEKINDIKKYMKKNNNSDVFKGYMNHSF